MRHNRLHDDNADIAKAPAAVDEGERADETRPPNTPVERPRPPDNADDEVERAGMGRVEVGTEDIGRSQDGGGHEWRCRTSTGWTT